MPAWARKALNPGLLTPLIKEAAPPGVTPDSRPTNARDSDVSVWTRAVQRAHAGGSGTARPPETRGPDQGSRGGAVHGVRQGGKHYVKDALDLPNAHSEYDRRATQERPEEL